MNYGIFISMLLIGLDSVQSAAFTHTQRKSDDHPLAWYHLPTAQSQPPNLPLTSNQSPYGPSTSNSFVPIPSPFVFPKPKTTEQLAASQIVNAAQERQRREFSMPSEDYEADESDENSIDRTNDEDAGVTRPPDDGGQRRRGTTTESALRKILSREITNIERYMPLLARKMSGHGGESEIGSSFPISGNGMRSRKTSTVIFPPSPRFITQKPVGARRRLVTTVPPTTTTRRRMNKKIKVVEEISKCRDCDRETTPTNTRVITTTARGGRGGSKLQVTVTNRRKQPTSRRPKRPRLPSTLAPEPLPIATLETSPPTPPPFQPETSGVTHRSFAKWTKFTLQPRRLLPTGLKGSENGATRSPLVLTTIPQLSTPIVEPTPSSTQKSIDVTTPLTPSSFLSRIFQNRRSRPWTHREVVGESVVSPNENVSPFEAAIVWASTELIEAVKDALARFRTSVTYSNIAASPSNGGSNLESAFRNIVDGGWLERTFANWAFSDTTTADSGPPDASAAAQKMDELWREAMLASAFSGAQHNEETQNQQSANDQRRSKSLRPFREESGRLIERVRLNDQPIETEHKTALNCQVFRKLCTILRIIQNDNVKPSS
ncbi:hypothetical protein M3Y95_00547100 [Aphelenchoides besseyi]|nr:hypothetical protein M3Y95_00547100 [Aphelenchoides besseyi]